MANRLFFYLILLIISTGCSFKKEHSIENNALDKRETIQKLDFYDVSTFKAVPLETKNGLHIRNIDKIIVDEDILFVLDRSDLKLLSFDSSGKFLAQIGKRGKGPNEYTFIGDVSLNREEKKVVLLDHQKRELLFYDYAGELLDRVSFGTYLGTQFNVVGKDKYLFLDRSISNNKGNDQHVFLKDSLGNILWSGAGKDDWNKDYYKYYTPNFFSNGEITAFIPNNQDDLYVYNGEYPEQVFSFGIQDKMITGKDLRNKKPYDINKYFVFRNLVVSKDSTFYCSISKKGKTVQVYGDLKRNRIFSGEILPDKQVKLFFPSPMASYDGYYVGHVTATLARLMLNKRDEIKDEDNPVLIFYKLKQGF